MLEADDSERACIPTKLQPANFCQLRKAEIGQKPSVACDCFRHGNLPSFGQFDVLPMYRVESWSALLDKPMSSSILLRPAHRG